MDSILPACQVAGDGVGEWCSKRGRIWHPVSKANFADNKSPSQAGKEDARI